MPCCRQRPLAYASHVAPRPLLVLGVPFVDMIVRLQFDFNTPSLAFENAKLRRTWRVFPVGKLGEASTVAVWDIPSSNVAWLVGDDHGTGIISHPKSTLTSKPPDMSRRRMVNMENTMVL